MVDYLYFAPFTWVCVPISIPYSIVPAFLSKYLVGILVALLDSSPKRAAAFHTTATQGLAPTLTTATRIPISLLRTATRTPISGTLSNFYSFDGKSQPTSINDAFFVKFQKVSSFIGPFCVFIFQVWAWKVTDEILHQNKELESCYFAAQTMRSKVQLSFHELPPESHASLRDSLIEHISRVNDDTNSAIVTQVSDDNYW